MRSGNSRLCRKLAIGLCALSIISWPSLLAEERPSSDPTGSAISPAYRTLATARRDALAELWRLRSNQMIRRLDSDFYLLKVLPNLIAAEQELAQSKQERISALQNQLVTMEQAERTTKERYEQRYATIADLAAVQANRAGVEQLLQQLKPDRTRPSIEQLAANRTVLLERAIAASLKRFERGEIDLKRVVMLQHQLNGALSDKAITAETRVGGLQRQVGIMQQIEALAKNRFENGVGHEYQYLQARAARIDLQRATTAASAGADDGRVKDALREYQQQELETLDRMVTLAKSRYQNGTGTFDLVSDATNQLYAARIATASTADQRAELLQGYYKWSVELENRARTGYQQGTATRTELLEASERRFSIQMAQLSANKR